MHAASNNKSDVVRLLLAHGADPLLTKWEPGGQKPRTAAECAGAQSHHELAQLLRDAKQMTKQQRREKFAPEFASEKAAAETAAAEKAAAEKAAAEKAAAEKAAAEKAAAVKAAAEKAAAETAAAETAAAPTPAVSLETSNYLAELRAGSKPRFMHQLMAAVHELIAAYAARHGLPSSRADGFFTKVQRNASVAGGIDEFVDPEQLMYVAVRLWTSAELLCGREFCAILNETIRRDAPGEVGRAATVAQAINAFCVTGRAGGAPVRWPPANRTYRGGAMPREFRSFFSPGKAYRANMYIATSFREDVSVNTFLQRLETPSAAQTPAWQEPVLWIFSFDGSLEETRRCVHVNYIDRTDGSVRNEDEFLFAPYSCFTVRCVDWAPAPVADLYECRPHRIEVDVAPDNRGMPAGLPLAPWC